MEVHSEDKKVIDLLSKLKNSTGGYPSEMFALRRQTYLKHAANIGLGIGAGAGTKTTVKSGNGAGAAVIPAMTSKILELALVGAIVVESGAVAYLYRDKIADLIRSYTGASEVQEVTPSPDVSSPVPGLIENINNPSDALLSTPSIIPSEFPSETLLPTDANNDNNANSNTSNNNNTSNNSPSVISTPNPNGNNGNHYGQTPKPERTKDKGNNNNNGNSGGNNNNGGSQDNKKDKNK